VLGVSNAHWRCVSPSEEARCVTIAIGVPTPIPRISRRLNLSQKFLLMNGPNSRPLLKFTPEGNFSRREPQRDWGGECEASPTKQESAVRAALSL
jgi:hypothetical protein